MTTNSDIISSTAIQSGISEVISQINILTNRTVNLSISLAHEQEKVKKLTDELIELKKKTKVTTKQVKPNRG